MSHSGYKLNISDENIKILSNMIPNFSDKIRSNIYTAKYFKKNVLLMESWHNKKKNQEIICYVDGIFFDNSKGIAIASCNIEGENFYTTLIHNKQNTSLLQLKLNVNSGLYGKKIDVVPKMKIACGTYFEKV